MDRDLFTYSNYTPVMMLDCTKAFETLTQTAKLYAHHLSQASWIGGLIVLLQTSPESPLIFLMLMRLFGAQDMDSLKFLALSECGISGDEFQGLLVYTSGILTNLGNYKEFEDTKFVPNIPKEKLKALVEKSDAFSIDTETMTFLWSKCEEEIFILNNKVKKLGFADNGVTTYFSSNCNQQDATAVNKFLQSKGMEAYNTRAFKAHDLSYYEIRLASELSDEDDDNLTGTYQYEGDTFKITRGDYSPLLGLVNKSLEEAKRYAENENEVKMLEKYIDSFRTGFLDAHKQGSVLWVNDKCPTIESYIGFIEPYRDPSGQRGEFEGFVAVVNKEMSAKFGKLVEIAESLLGLLPWPKAFEMDKFLEPDFTSLDILTYATSIIPTGINIPNYDEIRQNIGFKNFFLGNLISDNNEGAERPFLSVSDQQLLNKYGIASVMINVGLHELFGHGSGKLFRRNSDGVYNFNDLTVTNPITGYKIKSWYNDGETFVSKFLSLGLSYEECRADCVALLLSLSKDVLKIFGYEGAEAEDVIYVCWLDALLSGLSGLDNYDPEREFWGQGYAQAGFVILRVCLEAGEKFVTVTEINDSDGWPDLLLRLDRAKIKTVGKLTISTFLQKMQVYKSTADVTSATTMYNMYSSVLNTGVPFLRYRDIIVGRQEPRHTFFVLSNTFVTDNKVALKSYEATHEGLIQSWIERFPPSLDLVAILKPLWEKDHRKFVSAISTFVSLPAAKANKFSGIPKFYIE